MIGGEAVAATQVPQPVDAELAPHLVAEEHRVVGAARKISRQAAAGGRLVLGDRRSVEGGEHVARQQAPEFVLVVDDQNPDGHAGILHGRIRGRCHAQAQHDVADVGAGGSGVDEVASRFEQRARVRSPRAPRPGRGRRHARARRSRRRRSPPHRRWHRRARRCPRPAAGTPDDRRWPAPPQPQGAGSVRRGRRAPAAARRFRRRESRGRRRRRRVRGRPAALRIRRRPPGAWYRARTSAHVPRPRARWRRARRPASRRGAARVPARPAGPRRARPGRRAARRRS